MAMDEEAYVDKFNAQMMPITKAWCNGAAFVEVRGLQAWRSTVTLCGVGDQNVGHIRGIDYSDTTSIGRIDARDAQCGDGDWQYAVEGEV